jgi:hypothetical protein
MFDDVAAQFHEAILSAYQDYEKVRDGDTLLGQGAINEPSEGTYALTETAQEEIQGKI